MVAAARAAPVQIYARRCHWVAAELTKLGFSVPRPRAGFFLFARLPADFVGDISAESRDVALCAALAREGCIAVPGLAFGYPDHVRLALCADDETLRGALHVFAKVLGYR